MSAPFALRNIQIWGKLPGGEGLLGVQRVFQIAGARTTVASLWKIPDTATKLLMERFYTNLWEKGMTRIDALREAQLWALRNPTNIPRAGLPNSVSRVEQPIRLEPKYRAAFALSGDWR